MRIRRSVPDCVQASGAAARPSWSSRAKAASGDRSSAACEGNTASRPMAIASTYARPWVSLNTARRAASNSTKNPGGADFDDVHFGKRVRSIAIYRPALLGAKNTWRHQVELLAGKMEQCRAGDPQRQADLLDHRARPVEIDERVVSDDGAPAWRQICREAFQEGIEQSAPVRSSGTPAGEPAGELLRLHREVRKIGGDHVEAAAGDGPPHVALVELRVAVSELAKQQRARHHRLVLDGDAAERDGPERTERGQHHAAAGPDLQRIRAAHACSSGTQHLDQGRGIFAGTQCGSRCVSVNVRTRFQHKGTSGDSVASS